MSNNGRVELAGGGASVELSPPGERPARAPSPFHPLPLPAPAVVVERAHSQSFNVLSELGVVGLVLFVAGMVLFVAAAVGNPFSRRRDPLHPLLVALQVGVIAFLVHISWDWNSRPCRDRDRGVRLRRCLRLVSGDASGARAAEKACAGRRYAGRSGGRRAAAGRDQ